MFATLIFTSLLLGLSKAQTAQFRVIREWNYMNFTWENSDQLQEALAKGLYVPENIILSGITFHDEFYYMTLPRMFKGVPATLARIRANDKETAPLLQPYPSWRMNAIGDCSALQNVQHATIDASARLWIVDMGNLYTMTNSTESTCPPKLVIYDTKLDQVVTIYNFPQHVVNRHFNFLYDLVVDDFDGGYAYISDNSRQDPGIVVFRLKTLESWKIRHAPSMLAQRDATNFTVNGVGIHAPVNIAGIALGPKNPQGDRVVVYSPLSSFHIYSINASILRRRMYERNALGDDNVRDLGRRSSQSDGMIMDNTGALYYGLLSMSSIAKWNVQTKYPSGQRIISRDPTYIQWPSSFTFNNKGEIIALTNTLHKFIYGKMNLSEDNFRLLAAQVNSNSYIYDKLEQTDLNKTETTASDNEIYFHMVTDSARSAAELYNLTSQQSSTTTSATVQISNEIGHSSAGHFYYNYVTLLVCLLVYFCI